MAFTDLDETYPRGTQKVSILDDEQRNTRAWIKNNLPLISGYPDLETSKIMTYATADRPTTTKAGLLGYNTTTGAIEVSNNNGSFSPVDTGIAVGFITMFSGSFDSNGHPIDTKTGSGITSWALCNGANGTPDLRNRFVVGSGDTYGMGAIGGEATVSLNAAQNGPHSHTGRTDNQSVSGVLYGSGNSMLSGCSGVFHTISTGRYFASGDGHDGLDAIGFDYTHGHTVYIDVSGSGVPHNNMPPYYALAFIMKIS